MTRAFAVGDARPGGGGFECDLEVPEDSAFYAGHFEENPVLPGVAQLYMLEAVLRRVHGEAAAIDLLRGIRFRAPGLPGQSLSVRLLPGREERLYKFEVRAGDELLTNGGVRFGPRARHLEARTPPACDRSRRPEQPAPETLLPHRGPALLLAEALVLGDPDGDPHVCRGRVPAANALVAHDRLSTIAGIELAAQSAGFMGALQRPGSGPARGYLVAVKETSLPYATVPADADLLASFRRLGKAGAITMVGVEIFALGEVVLAGELTTWVQE